MSLGILILLLFLGIALLLLEFLIVPGITIAGIGGIICLFLSIYFAYDTLGVIEGSYFLIGSILFLAVTLIFAFRSKTWDKIMLKNNINSKITAIDTEHPLNPGDIGVSITRLNPMGKILINDGVYEAKSLNGFLNEKTEVIVVKISGNQIIVKQKNN